MTVERPPAEVRATARTRPGECRASEDWTTIHHVYPPRLGDLLGVGGYGGKHRAERAYDHLTSYAPLTPPKMKTLTITVLSIILTTLTGCEALGAIRNCVFDTNGHTVTIEEKCDAETPPNEPQEGPPAV